MPSTRPDVRGEWLHPSDSTGNVILYIHGGGFVSCSAATHRPITSRLARSTGASVFAVDYPLSPESRHPAALDAVMEAYRWLVREVGTAGRLAVVGDSAGGNLTLGLLVRARDEGVPLPACAVALSPWLDLSASSPSVQSNDGRCAMFRPRNMIDFARAYLGTVDPSARYASPIDCDLSGLPPVLFQVGSSELLLDDALRAHERIQSAGGQSEVHVFDGVFHGWHMLDGIVPEARRAIMRVSTFLADRHPPR
jgi:acetyl esterase/lipase